MGTIQLLAPMKKHICNYAGIDICRIPVELQRSVSLVKI